MCRMRHENVSDEKVCSTHIQGHFLSSKSQVMVISRISLAFNGQSFPLTRSCPKRQGLQQLREILSHFAAAPAPGH